MKSKSKNQIVRKRKEFRYHNVEIVNNNGTITRIRHPSYVFLEKGNIYIYISITHSDNVENSIVIKLRKNPNPNDKRESYRIAEIKEDTKDRFNRNLKKWVMDIEDDKDIRKEYEKKMILSIGVTDLWTREDRLPEIICRY